MKTSEATTSANLQNINKRCTLHPTLAAEFPSGIVPSNDFTSLQNLLGQTTAVAIGGIGGDFTFADTTAHKQAVVPEELQNISNGLAPYLQYHPSW